MDFWRSGQARTYRDASVPRKGMGLWQRLTGFHFPAWMPVAFIIVVVFGILGLLFYTRSTSAGPRIGDHWHAPISIFVCGERQTNAQQFEAAGGSPGTHGDGVMHQHPFAVQAEGVNSSVSNYFEQGNGKLTSSELKAPAKRESYKAGQDTCDGQEAEIRVLKGDTGIHPLGGDFSRAITTCDGLPESAFERVNGRYVPQDGDCIRVVFSPPEVEPVVQPDRTIIDAAAATRTIEMEVSGNAEATAFSPPTVEASAGEIVRIRLTNVSPDAFHGLRFSGADGQYGTSDDYVMEPPTLDPGQQGEAIIRYDAPGEYEFRDENVTTVVGKVVVGEAQATPALDATPTPVPADISLNVSATDAAFDPTTLTVEAGKRFKISLLNNGTFIHNLRIAGPDGEYRTEDDIAADGYVNPGGQGEVSGQIDSPGEYGFRCDFHPTVHFGTLTVQ